MWRGNQSARVLAVALGIGLLGVVLFLVISGARATHPLSQRVLYHTTWATGTAGWRSADTAGWHLRGRTLVTDGQGGEAFIAPISTGKRTAFTVEATIRYVEPFSPKPQPDVIVLVARSPDVNFALWVHGSRYFAYGGNNGSIAGTIFPLTGQLAVWADPAQRNLAVSAYHVDQHWHTYRLVVQGTAYHLFVDGRETVSATFHRSLDHPYLGLWTAECHVEVRSFTVTVPA